jgi:hypothetical protein
MSDLLSRPGTLRVSRSLIEHDPEGLLIMLKDVLVVKIEDEAFTPNAIYYGYSKHFDVQEGDSIPPRYWFSIIDGKVEWRKANTYNREDVHDMMAKLRTDMKEDFLQLIHQVYGQHHSKEGNENLDECKEKVTDTGKKSS